MIFTVKSPREWDDSEQKLVIDVIIALVIYGLAITVMAWPLAAALVLFFFYSRETGGIVCSIIDGAKEIWKEFSTAFTEAFAGKPKEQA